MAPGRSTREQRQFRAGGVGENGGRALGCAERTETSRPTGGDEGVGGVLEFVDGVDGQHRPRRPVVGYEDQRGMSEVHGGHVGAEGTEAPAQARPGRADQAERSRSVSSDPT